MTAIIDSNTGKVFQPSAIFAGYVLLAFGLFSMIDKPLFGLGLALIGVFISFTSEGIQVDAEKKLYREYTRYFGIKKGPWKSLDDYIYITTIATTINYSSYSRGMVELTDKDKYFDVCLLNSSRQKKLLIKRCKDKEVAIAATKELAGKLGVQHIEYNP
jgi:hypothetical protein